MKKQLILIATIPLILGLASCSNEEVIKPTKLTAVSETVRLILNSERDLNDIVTLKFDPINVTNKEVLWSATSNEIFTLNGDMIHANKIGTDYVRATSILDENIYADIKIEVYDPNLKAYKVNYSNSSDYEINGLKEEYFPDEEVTFTINLLNEEKAIEKVLMNSIELLSETNSYSFKMPKEDVTLDIKLKDLSKPVQGSALYNIKYDLEGRQTAKKIETSDVLLNTFSYSGEGTSIITGINSFINVYGGGYGGKGDTKWVSNDLLKLGTTSVNGGFSLSLSEAVYKVNIKCFTGNQSLALRIGDEASSDFDTNETIDTALYTCSDINIANKENVETNNVSTLTVEFKETKNLKIMTTNNKPFYIQSIELFMK